MGDHVLAMPVVRKFLTTREAASCCVCSVNQFVGRARRKGILPAGRRGGTGYTMWLASDVALLSEKPEPKKPDVREDPDGTLYFILAEGAARVKIGWSRAGVQRRLTELQTGSAFPLRIVHTMSGTLRDELELHEFFDGERVSLSGEWFHLRGRLLVFLRLAGAA